MGADDLRALRGSRLARHLGVRGAPADGQCRCRARDLSRPPLLRSLALVRRAGVWSRSSTSRWRRAHRADRRGPGSATPAALPADIGGRAQVRRVTVRRSTATSHHLDAVGKGDPQCFAGTAGTAKFAVGDTVTVRELPAIFYTRTPEYCAGRGGDDRRGGLREPGARGRGLGPGGRSKPEWFYIVRFNHGRPVGRLHRAPERHAADRDPGALAPSRRLSAGSTDSKRRRRDRNAAYLDGHGHDHAPARAAPAADGRGDHRLRGAGDRAARARASRRACSPPRTTGATPSTSSSSSPPPGPGSSPRRGSIPTSRQLALDDADRPRAARWASTGSSRPDSAPRATSPRSRCSRTPRRCTT